MSHVLVNVAWPYANGPRHIGLVAGFGVPSDVFSRYDSYTRASNSDEPIEGVRYLLVDTGESYSSSMLPLIRYALDDSALEETGRPDQLTLRRLKKQKLSLKDQIVKIEDQLIPDIIA